MGPSDADYHPRRFRIILNPKSGKGKGFDIFRNDVVPILSSAGCNIVFQEGAETHPTYEYVDNSSVVTITKRVGEAEAIAKGLQVNDFDTILCIGGDGTIHEAINGLANREDAGEALAKISIATVPAGTRVREISLR
jgi:sphingosine kinase